MKSTHGHTCQCHSNSFDIGYNTCFSSSLAVLLPINSLGTTKNTPSTYFPFLACDSRRPERSSVSPEDDQASCFSILQNSYDGLENHAKFPRHKQFYISCFAHQRPAIVRRECSGFLYSLTGCPSCHDITLWTYHNRTTHPNFGLCIHTNGLKHSGQAFALVKLLVGRGNPG